MAKAWNITIKGFTKDSISKVKSMAKESLYGMTGLNMREIFIKGLFMEKATTENQIWITNTMVSIAMI